ncbi:hypothetical protein BOW53_11070 [Solemya pervernicosa gill symbiont]|uniref:Lytic transglycosylase n=2 Tax=Gammaproteobacteria incertae sedis TaxID=118884 RepID=A0A1T2L385_9GAMM|nr:hypothetical protein BOW53_11070 [Solemya pervernicosa gill symbiont]
MKDLHSHSRTIGHLLARLLLPLLALSAFSIQADIYKYTDKDGVVTYSSLKPMGLTYEELIPSCLMSYIGCDMANSDWRKVALNTEAFKDLVAKAAKRHNVDAALVRAVIHAESAFNRKAVSRAGAKGLMQLMPTTARYLGVGNPFNAAQNIDGGAKYLSELLGRFGNQKLAIAAYNAGPTAVTRYNGIPPYKETKNYVKRVSTLLKRYRSVIN